MEKCKTERDGYRCERSGEHDDCEAQAPEYAHRRTLEDRVRVLEQQVRSLQMSAPRGIPDLNRRGER